MPSETIGIKVVAKCSLLSDEEIEKGCKKIVKVSGDKISVEGGGKEQSFSFDSCYGPESRSSKIYQETCDSILQKAFVGYNVTFMAIGTAGSGKSHLMSGTEENPGIIPSVNREIFRYIDSNRGNKEFFVTVSFVEVLDEQMTDMLNPHTNDMKLRDSAKFGIYVEGLSELVVHTYEDLARLYEQGNRARKMGASDVQAHRARSNGIFMITLEQRERNSGSKVGVRSVITFADLAGVEPGGDSGVGSKVLMDVFNAVKKGGHVPYRNSRVTRLLQDSLGGNAATVIFATVSPSDKQYQNTIQTLQMSQNVRGTKNHVKMNLNETEQMISELREEISHLRNKIAKGKDASKDDVLKMEQTVQVLQHLKGLTWEAKEQASQTYESERKSNLANKDLVNTLKVIKMSCWSEKQKKSIQYEDERQTNLANKGILEWVMDTMKKGDKEVQEKILILQKEKDQLTLEYKDKRKKVDDMKEDLQKRIADYSKLAESGKANENETKQRVGAIHELKERLRKETDNLKEIKKRLKDVQDKQKNERMTAQGAAPVKGNAELRQMVEAEERRRLENEHKAMVAEEMERTKIEGEHEKAEIQIQAAQGKQYTTQTGSQIEMELVDMKAERSVVTLQIQVLQQEKAKLTKDLEEVYKRHKEELEIQQLQHFQTFRQYREMFEKQKAVLEDRYRSLIEDAVQDAVFLSTRNAELVQENQAQKQTIAELKDKLTVQGDGSRPETSKSKK